MCAICHEHLEIFSNLGKSLLLKKTDYNLVVEAYMNEI